MEWWKWRAGRIPTNKRRENSMINSEKTVVEQALGLSSMERATLARELIQSPEFPENVDPHADVLWQEEIIRRLRDVKTGKVTCLSWDEVRDRLTEQLLAKFEIHPEAVAELEATVSWYEQQRRGLGKFSGYVSFYQACLAMLCWKM
ncbi:MAG: addiction module protein [Magnetococcales bacterium]|nr:addiction module protein [Magnetococcales bacterium]